MCVMMLIRATADSEAGVMPSTELVEAMGRYNRELVDAGVRGGATSVCSWEACRGPGRTVAGGRFADNVQVGGGACGCGKSEILAGRWRG